MYIRGLVSFLISDNEKNALRDRIASYRRTYLSPLKIILILTCTKKTSYSNYTPSSIVTNFIIRHCFLTHIVRMPFLTWSAYPWTDKFVSFASASRCTTTIRTVAVNYLQKCFWHKWSIITGTRLLFWNSQHHSVVSIASPLSIQSITWR